MNIGSIGCCGTISSKYVTVISHLMEQEMKRKTRENLLESFGVKSKDENYNKNILQTISNMNNIGQKQKLTELQEIFEEQTKSSQKILTIKQLKKQIKYSKNPMEVKMLNRKLNEIYKEMRRRNV